MKNNQTSDNSVSPSDEETELAKLLASAPETDATERGFKSQPINETASSIPPPSTGHVPLGLCQWADAGGKRFVATGRTQATLDPGVYRIDSSPDVGLYFEKVEGRLEGLLRFPDSTQDEVLSEIQRFWERGQTFAQFGLPHKRGILLWGPPGGGKTSLVRLLSRDVVERGGIVVQFTSPYLFTEGLRRLRRIQPTTPVVSILEDFDSLIENHCESDILNILDGIERFEKIVHLATTNYPEKLGPRIVNRPSRFDKRFRVGLPSLEARTLYMDYLLGDHDLPGTVRTALEGSPADTDGFSIAHLQELFTTVAILGNDYGDALKLLRGMTQPITSENERGRAGFLQAAQGGKVMSDVVGVKKARR